MVRFRIWTNVLTGVVYADLVVEGMIIATMSAKDLAPYNIALYAYK